MSDFKLPESEMANHPIQRNYGPDTPIDYDEEPWLRICAENVAENDAISEDQAKLNIRMGCDNEGDYAKPRQERIPLSNTVEDDNP